MSIAGSILVLMVVLTCANILSRQVWVPIRGTFELMGFLGAAATALAMGFAQQRKEHIAVTLLTDKFPRRIKIVTAALSHFFCIVFFALLAWQLVQKALILAEAGEVTETLRIIYYPFTFIVALGCLVQVLMLLEDLIETLQRVTEPENE